MNRVRWLLNRVRVMSLPELASRLRRSLTRRVEQGCVAAGWQPRPGVTVKARMSLFGVDGTPVRAWQQRFQLDAARLESYMAGRIDFFGHEPLDVGMPVAWHRDPVTGTGAPRTFGKALNYRDDRIVGNVKFLWELGRHQHLVPLAVAYAVSGDNRYRQAVVDQVDGWMARNPYGIGIHWCSALEVSLRLISWAVVHSLLALRDGEAGLFAAVPDPERLGVVIYQQAFFVRHYLSGHSSANNHLIGELTGLWVACQVFDLGDKGNAWAEVAREMLERESGYQVYDDGVDKEQACYYHLWVLEYFLMAWLVGQRTGRPFSEAFTVRILAMAQFLEDVSPMGGEPPGIGDADDGCVVRFAPAWPVKPYREVLEAVRGVLGEPGSGDGEKAFWYHALAGPGSGSGYHPGRERCYPVTYPQGGYAVMGGAGCHLVFDAGDLGYLGIAAHGHADALSFCLALDGDWWLVDPGTYAYHSDPEWRSYFRGTAAHNTIRINRHDQSQMGGPFLWLRKAHAWIEKASESDGIQVVRGCHDGYQGQGVRHCRELRLLPAAGLLEVLDELTGADDHTDFAEIHYHFAPDVDITPGPAANCWVASRPGSDRRLVFYMDPLWECALARGSTNPVSGWFSPALEEKVPANTLRGEAVFSAALQSTTRIVIE